MSARGGVSVGVGAEPDPFAGLDDSPALSTEEANSQKEEAQVSANAEEGQKAEAEGERQNKEAEAERQNKEAEAQAEASRDKKVSQSD